MQFCTGGKSFVKIEPEQGLIGGARQVPSPNCDKRPEDNVPEVIVIHAISLPPGKYGGREIEAFFCNELDCEQHQYFNKIKDLKVSAHAMIRRNGEVIQFVPLMARAWHAGVSSCLGRTRVNDFSIGIELEGSDDEPFEEIQYTRLVELSRAIMEAYPSITRERIFGHADISPGRKTDPGPHFDWPRYLAMLDR